MIVATKINNSLEICKGLVQFSYGRGAILSTVVSFCRAELSSCRAFP